MRWAFVIAGMCCAGCPSAATPSDALPPWREGVSLPALALEPGVAALGQRLVVLGGFETSLQAGLHITNRVHVLDTFTGEWSPLPDAPVAWTHPNVAGVGSSLYLLGGLEGQDFIPRGETFVLGPDGVWTMLAPIPLGLERGAAAVVVVPPHIYLLGGASATGAVATGLDYNLITNSWTQLPDLPEPRSHAAAMQRVDGALIVAGGLATVDSSQPRSDVWILPFDGTPFAEAWQLDVTAPMPTPRGGCASGELAGQLICAGGESGVAALQIVEAYDPYTNTWSTLPAMPDARAGTQGAVIGQQLYVPGGANRLVFEPLDTLFIFSR